MKVEILKYGIYGAVIAVVLFCLFSCNDVKQQRILYTAVKAKDTAFLEITAYEKRFYGTYQVYYVSRSMKDSGAVEGEISGDTLRGKFRYISYGGSKTISPIIFLRSGNKLKQGRGVVASYMGISYFMPDSPIEFNDSFVFDSVR
ncbi:hypothetical protein [Flavobacterium salmonis]|uniref:Uncharacterized protein n=1 Tax=Flavobacterium salmonis TaxID=2654844 RepID=A0A6V6YS51_9FLAO|nr:hypothetical protein [Flavobacterium salmonis]CAD0002348.1 hypothetical protein FLAT13_01077 [Flavobacterium salmonis]